ncbi:unnamed protein product [Larinioides sclopetarius]|uniref:Uncharacterized protein n=1 Tax=Larinioides sclopetarius TaxID=280406 RepID=A0AAV2C1N3_9ARAC
MSAQMFGAAGQEHMMKYGTTKEHFAKIARKNHKHSVHNQNSQSNREHTLQEILESPVVYGPLTRLQCCPTSNGAAAAVVVSRRFVEENHLQSQAVEIVGMEMATDPLNLSHGGKQKCELLSNNYPIVAAPMSAQMFGAAGQEHMMKYGTTKEHFAIIARKNHKHSVHNQNSQSNREYTLQEILESPVVYGPLTRLQCCPTSNGAAAAVVVSRRFVEENHLQSQAVEIVGMEMATDPLSLSNGGKQKCELLSNNYPIVAAPMSAQMFGAAGQEHMMKYGTTKEHFAKIARKNHKQSVHNQNSQSNREYTLQEILESPVVYGPLTRLQCCPTSNGAAAAVVVSRRFVEENHLQSQAVEIVGMEMATDPLSLSNGGKQKCELLSNNYPIVAAPMSAQMFGAAGQEHMMKYGTTKEHFAKIARKNHKHSVHNQNSQSNREYTLQEILESPVVYGPLPRLQCCPTSNGADAAVVVSRRFVEEKHLQSQAVEIVGIGNGYRSIEFEPRRKAKVRSKSANAFKRKKIVKETAKRLLSNNYPIVAAPMSAQMFGAAGQEHMMKYGTTKEHFAKIARKNHKHSVHNQNSQSNREYTLQEILESPVVYGPLPRLQCCPTSNGAAAAVVVSRRFVEENHLQSQAVEIVGMEMATDPLNLSHGGKQKCEEFIKTAVKEKLTKSSADDEKRPKHLNVLDRFRTKSK